MKRILNLLLFTMLLIPVLNSQELVMLGDQFAAAKVPSIPGENDLSGTGNERMKTTAYEFIYYDMTEKIESIDMNSVGNNFFGKQVAQKQKVFEDNFTYQVPVGPGSPATKTIIRKPAIYMAINKLYKYYKKSVKSESLTHSEAVNEYNRILDIALSALYQQSEEFERNLSEIKDPEILAGVFSSVALVR